MHYVEISSLVPKEGERQTQMSSLVPRLSPSYQGEPGNEARNLSMTVVLI